MDFLSEKGFERNPKQQQRTAIVYLMRGGDLLAILQQLLLHNCFTAKFLIRSLRGILVVTVPLKTNVNFVAAPHLLNLQYLKYHPADFPRFKMSMIYDLVSLAIQGIYTKSFPTGAASMWTVQRVLPLNVLLNSWSTSLRFRLPISKGSTRFFL